MKWFAALLLTMTISAEQRLVEGNASSPVRVVAYEDLQCPDCAAFRKMMDEHLLPRFGAKIAFEHRDFPLPKHDWARKASVAARYFEQVKPELGVAFRRETMATIDAVKASGFETHLRAFAKKHGADEAKAMAALADAKLGALVEEDYQEGIARGVGRTPTVLVNSRPFIETFTLAEITAGIEAEMKERNVR
ncbi:MAG: thioredoxin domain-containing protein [Bryobacteraceae bacterium]